MLKEVSQHTIKDKDKPNFFPEPFNDIILSEKYLIDESQIFYLSQEKPLMNGIMDMEELADIPDKNKLDKRYATGPYCF